MKPAAPSAEVKDNTAAAPAGPVSYAPPARLLERLVTFTNDKRGAPTATMPAEVFTKLLEAAMFMGFDETAYLADNADVKDGVATGRIPHGLRHFALHGYFEGRAPLNYEVDETWYLNTYPDVKKAISTGVVVDATDHFRAFGYAEGRVPSPRYQQIIGEWMNLVTALKTA